MLLGVRRGVQKAVRHMMHSRGTGICLGFDRVAQSRCLSSVVSFTRESALQQPVNLPTQSMSKPLAEVSYGGIKYAHIYFVPVALSRVPDCGLGVVATEDIAKDALIHFEKDAIAYEQQMSAEALIQYLESLGSKSECEKTLFHCWVPERDDGGQYVQWAKHTAAFFNHADSPNVVATKGGASE